MKTSLVDVLIRWICCGKDYTSDSVRRQFFYRKIERMNTPTRHVLLQSIISFLYELYIVKKLIINLFEAHRKSYYKFTLPSFLALIECRRVVMVMTRYCTLSYTFLPFYLALKLLSSDWSPNLFDASNLLKKYRLHTILLWDVEISGKVHKMIHSCTVDCVSSGWRKFSFSPIALHARDALK